MDAASILSWQIKEKYDLLNKIDGDSKWDYLAYNQGMVGDIGDLTKLLMTKAGMRRSKSQDLDKDIEHELCDVLWSVLSIAKELNIDLSQAFTRFSDQFYSGVTKVIGKKTNS